MKDKSTLRECRVCGTQTRSPAPTYQMLITTLRTPKMGAQLWRSQIQLGGRFRWFHRLWAYLYALL